MIGVETRDFNENGIADLDEALDLAKNQGIANARGAVSKEITWSMFSLGAMVGSGMAAMVPGVIGGTKLGGNSVYAIDPGQAPELLVETLRSTEQRVLEAAGDELPGWRPTSRKSGIRMVAMSDGADFEPHTDDYEGLVVAVQLGVDGEKVMNAEVGGELQEEPINQGDIIFFAGDTFRSSDQVRTKHGFRFTGLYAVSFTLGQDPWYTISGSYPMIEENPQYNLTPPDSIR